MQPEVENAGAPAPDPAAPPAVAADAAAQADAAADEAAWAGVLAAWGDEARHRAYLDRAADLAGLAVAGGRYREVLRARPDDPLALRFRDEVLRRATAQALVAVPHTVPDLARGRKLARVAAMLVLAGLLFAGILLARDLLALLGARP